MKSRLPGFLIFFILGFMVFNLGSFLPHDFGAEGSAPPPNDGLDGIQYLVGDWLVNTSESYKDEIIDLRGNLTIDSGGILTFKNVTLRLNITASNQNYKIRVNDGGVFNILDNDSDPMTMDDSSVITDGTQDSDNQEASSDYRYFFMIYAGGIVDIQNSRVEELGTQYYTNDEERGLYVKSGKLTIRNSTFSKCYWSIWMVDNYDSNNRSLSVDNSTFENCFYGLYLDSVERAEIKYSVIQNYNYQGFYLRNVNKIYIFNITLYNQLKSTYAFYAQGTSNIFMSGCTIEKVLSYGMYLDSCSRVWIENCTFDNINYLAIYNIANSNSHFTFNYNKFYQTWQGAIYSTNSDYLTIVGNDMNQMYSQPVIIYSSDYVIFDKNEIYDFQYYPGLEFNYINYFKMRNNTIDFYYYFDYIYPLNIYNCKYFDFENNTLSNFYDYGIYFSNIENVVVKYNDITGSGFSSMAMEISSCSNMIMIENYISGFNYGLYFNNINYYSQIPLRIYGGKITGSNYHLTVDGNSKIETYNLSFDPDKIYMWNPSGSPTVKVYYPVNVYVHDTLGAIGGAEVVAHSKTKNLEIVSFTEKNGRQRLWVLNGTYQFNSKTYFTPYNISANISGLLGYPPQEYHINSYTSIDIYFNSNTKPSAPVNFFYRINHSSVDLFWDCYVNDLKSYKIYRQNKTGGSWQEIGYITNPNSSISKSWKDYANATDLIEYNYKIHHIDTAMQEGNNTKWLLFDDWVFADKKIYTDKNLVINGSLIIESGGELWLDNVSITMDEQVPINGDLIEVRAGGKLYITDNLDISKIDENTTSTINCTPSSPDDNYGFLVRQNGFLEIRNSYIKNASNYMEDVNKNCIIYMDSGKVNIFNSTFIVRDFGLYFDSVDGGVVYGNNFENDHQNRYDRAIQIINSKNLSIFKNSFNRSLDLELYSIGSENIIIDKNIFNCENKSAIYLTESDRIVVSNNTIIKPVDGIYLSHVINSSIIKNEFTNFMSYGVNSYYCKNLSLQGNIFRDAPLGDYGIYIHDSEDSSIDENIVFNIGSSHRGIYCYIYKDLTITSNTIHNIYQGIYLRNIYSAQEAGEVLIQNNTVYDTGLIGYGFYLYSCNGENFKDNTIYKSYYGVQMYNSWDLYWEQNTIFNCTYGFRQERGERNLYFNNLNWGCRYTYFFLNSAKARIYNCSITGTPPFTVYVNTSSDVVLTNPYFNLNKLYVSDITSRIEIQWTFDLQVFDQFGIPQKDISVIIRNIYGTKMYESSTDASGVCYFILLSTRIQFFNSNLTYNPHTFEAKLGYHSGIEQFSITSSGTVSMWLDNKAPSAYNVIINPFRPLTKQNLEINYVFSDPEYDLDKGSIIRWYKNGIYQPALDNKTFVEGDYTQKGDFWYCKLTPFDGADYGTESTSTYSWVVNSKPTVNFIKLMPEEPDSTQNLWVNYSYIDDDGDPELGTIFKWYLWDGSSFNLMETSNTPELNYSWTGKGERWMVSIEPRDGETFGEAVYSDNVTIGNSAPKIENASILPLNPKSSDNLTVYYDFIDIDNDPEGATSFQWLRMGAGNLTYNLTDEKNRSVPAKKLFKGERWKCVIIPNDGNNFGLNYTSQEVFIENTPPELKPISIQPAVPMTTDELFVDVDTNYFDSDNDPPGDHSYEWLKWSEKGGVYLRTGLKLERLPSIFTNKDDIWICEVTPFDGYNYGEPVRTEPVQVGNSPPKASSLSITPQNPTTTATLKANYIYFDENNDLENGTLILWYKDGSRQLELDNQLYIDNSLTSRGEIWYFSVIPKDGSLKGKTMKSPDVKIKNSPPEILQPVISNLFPRGDEDLEIDFEYFDADGDGNKRTDIRWYKDGILQSLYNNWFVIPANATEKDQEWQYQIRAFDGNDTSPFNESFPVTIRNSKPILTEYSPEENELTITETESLEFSVSAADMDGDVLLYQWVMEDQETFEAVGMGEDSVLTYKTDYSSAGIYIINVTIRDWGTNSYKIYKEWKLTVINNNRLPIIIVDNPLNDKPKMKNNEKLEFEITAYDLDSDDHVSLEWFIGSTLAATKTNHYVYEPGKFTKGKHTVRVVVSDGHESVSKHWNVTVTQEKADLIFGYTWDQWSVFIQVFVIIATAIIGFIGFQRLRKKKGVLQEYLNRIDTPMKGWKDDPEKSEAELITVVNKIEKDYNNGIIEDLHYFLLDRQIKENLKEMRQWKIDNSFDYLPPSVANEVTKILEDGKITDNEYLTFVEMLDHTDGMNLNEKKDIKMQMRKWRDMDRERDREKRIGPVEEPSEVETLK